MGIERVTHSQVQSTLDSVGGGEGCVSDEVQARLEESQESNSATAASREQSNGVLGEEALARYQWVVAAVAEMEAQGLDEDELDALREEKGKLEAYGVRPSRDPQAIGASLRAAIEGGEGDAEWLEYLNAYGTDDSPALEASDRLVGDGALARRVVTQDELTSLSEAVHKDDRESLIGDALLAKKPELEQERDRLQGELECKNDCELEDRLDAVNVALHAIDQIEQAADDQDFRPGWLGGGSSSAGMLGNRALERLKQAGGSERAFLEKIVGDIDEQLSLHVNPQEVSAADQTAAAAETQRLNTQGSNAVCRLRDVEGMLRELEAYGCKESDNWKALEVERQALTETGIRSDTPPVEAGLKLDSHIQHLNNEKDSGLFGWRLKLLPWDDSDLEEKIAYLEGFNGEQPCEEAAPCDPVDAAPCEPADAAPCEPSQQPTTCFPTDTRRAGGVSGCVAPGALYEMEPGKTVWDVAGELKAMGVPGSQRDIMNQIHALNPEAFRVLNPIEGDVVRLPMGDGMLGCERSASLDDPSTAVRPGGCLELTPGTDLMDVAQQLQQQGVPGDTAVIMDLILFLNRDQALMPGAVLRLPEAQQVREQLPAFKMNRYVGC